MKIKFLYIDKDGKISLTKAELDEIMTNCYNDGYEDARKLYGNSLQTYIYEPTYKDYITCSTQAINCDSAEKASNCAVTNALS